MPSFSGFFLISRFLSGEKSPSFSSFSFIKSKDFLMFPSPTGFRFETVKENLPKFVTFGAPETTIFIPSRMAWRRLKTVMKQLRVEVSSFKSKKTHLFFETLKFITSPSISTFGKA